MESPTVTAVPAEGAGRGPRERVRRAVMDATTELLAEVGFSRLTVDAIAERSGIAKATVYRWWSNRADVAMDALLEQRDPVGWFVADGPAIESLRRQLFVATDFLSGPSGTVVAGLLGDAQHDPQLAEAFRRRFLGPLFALTHELIATAVAEGDLRADVAPETLIDMLTGSLYFRLLVTGEPLTADVTARVVEAVLRGAQPGSRRRD